MSEKNIELNSINLVDIYGVNDAKLNLIKERFPDLKIIARGNILKVVGNDDEIEKFEHKINEFIAYYKKHKELTSNNIEQLMDLSVSEAAPAVYGDDSILVHGPEGLTVKARTANQRKLVSSFAKNDIVFAIGPAGSGKTYTAVALAVRALKNKEVRRIILTRPAVEAGENLGFLPGDLKDKLDPYLQPLYDALYDMVPAEKLRTYLHDRVIEIAPLAFMRGRTLDYAVIILDEAQNATQAQLKMLLTRMGRSAKIIVTGDITQVDLPPSQSSGLLNTSKLLSAIEGIDFIYLNENDVLRHELVKKMIKAFEQK